MLNYTTAVPVVRTIGEIQAMLAGHGAVSIAVDYRGGKPSGLAFSLPTPPGPMVYMLPVNVAAVHTLLVRQRERNRRVDDRPEQAERVAWRVIKDWLAAQLALIETEMATLDQILLPYLIVSVGGTEPVTLYQQFQAGRMSELEAK